MWEDNWKNLVFKVNESIKSFKSLNTLLEHTKIPNAYLRSLEIMPQYKF